MTSTWSSTPSSRTRRRSRPTRCIPSMRRRPGACGRYARCAMRPTSVRRQRGLRSSGLLDRDAVVLEVLLELARLEHLGDDVGAADELALDVELWDGRPVRIGLDALAKFLVLQHISAVVVDPDIVEDLDDAAREAAHREIGRALHIEEHVVVLHLLVDERVDIGHG